MCVRACVLQLAPEQPLVLPAGVQPRLQRHHVLQLVISRQSVATGGGGTAVVVWSGEIDDIVLVLWKTPDC